MASAKTGSWTGFLDGGGEAARRILARDWHDHPLGVPERWPDALKTALSLIVNSPESMILAWGPELTFFFNDAYTPLLGPRAAWAMGARFDHVWADAWLQARPIIEDAFAGRSVRYEDLPWKLDTDRGAAETWFTFSYSRVLDSCGDVAGLFILTNETTSQVLDKAATQRATEALRQAEAQLRRAQQAGGIGVFAVESDGAVHATPEFFSLYGVPEREGTPSAVFERLVLAEDADKVSTFANRASGVAALDVEYRIRRADTGEIRWIARKGEIESGEGGRFLRFVGAASDISRRKRAEEDLRRLNAHLEREVQERTADRNALWQLSRDLMLRCTFEGVITAVNPAWTEVLGWREDELIGADLFDFIHPDDLEHTVKGANDLSQGVSHTRLDNRYRAKAGGYRWISWSTRDAEGMINAVGRDITAEKEQTAALANAAEALRQSQKMEAVGQLTGGVAHDFNNLLTIIRSSVDYLRRPNLPDDRRKRYMDAVSDTVDRAAKLTSQLLAFSRRQALKPEVFEVGKRLRAVADMLDTITGARVRVMTVLPEEPCYVRADLSQFETALVNMAVNARDAMNGAGTLTLHLTSSASMPPIRGHGGGSGAFAIVEVTDTGTGIAPDQLGRIFEPFFTTKEVGKGTGLGLSQVFGFAKQSGGDIDVESRWGQGTTFRLYLPEVETAPDLDDVEDEDGPAPGGGGRRVLVVEDNVEVGRFATQILEDLGYQTTWAANGEEALDKIGPDGDGFDIVFSDVVMPGMGGIALARELRHRLPQMPVVLASGYSDVLAENADHGFELLQKPYSADQLSRILRRAIGARRFRQRGLG